jgi:hypothetical protein
MTFAMNIKTKYRIPVLLNNKKKLLQRTIKKRQSRGTLHAVPITRNYTKIPVTGKNTQKIIITRKQGTIEEILIRGNNAKIQLIRNNTRNNNHKEQYQNTTYREQ